MSASVVDDRDLARGAVRLSDGVAHPASADDRAGTPDIRRIAFRRRPDGRLQGAPRIIAIVVAVATFCSMFWMYFRRIGKNPAGFFCDEAEIGVRTWQLIHGTLPEGSPRFPLFYNHFGTVHLGALPLYTTAPFMMIFGPSEWSVRLASVFWSTVAIVALLVLVRTLRLRNGWIGVAAFALSPIAIHVARITFGHAGSFAAMALGLAVYAAGRERRSAWMMIVAGALLGISVYGYASWYFATPLLMVSLAMGELIANGLRWCERRRWTPFVTAALACLIVWIPVVYRALTNPAFADRFRSKELSAGTDSGWNAERLRSMLDQYPKYFSFDFLVRYGDVGFISRHSVKGAGLFPWIVLALVVIGAVAVVLHRRATTAKVIGIAALGVTILMPLPDLPTTSPNTLPYSFSVYSMLIGVPILCAFGVSMVSGWIGGRVPSSWRQAVIPVVLSAIVLVGAWSFYRGPYANYPDVSADYWGWQFGPGPAFEAFLADNNQHDHYYLDSDYNGADAFPQFYLLDHPDMAAKSGLGSPHEHMVSMERDMYAVKPDRWEHFVGPHDALRQYARLVDIIYYPDGTPALLILSISLQNGLAPANNW
ncbi:MAG: hypothetical protein QM589_06265 [Thermomicrobiales bacterium]